jgi:hypothetical protein
VSRKHDVKQFRQACREADLTVEERYKASEALHDDKAAGAVHADMHYGEMLAWLQEWKDSWRRS